MVTIVTKGIKTNCENFLAADTDEKRAEDLSCLNIALIQLNDVFSMYQGTLRSNVLWVERDFLDGLYYNPTISRIQEKLRDDLVGDISYDYYYISVSALNHACDKMLDEICDSNGRIKVSALLKRNFIPAVNEFFDSMNKAMQ